jgi:hypothetical protein
MNGVEPKLWGRGSEIELPAPLENRQLAENIVRLVRGFREIRESLGRFLGRKTGATGWHRGLAACCNRTRFRSGRTLEITAPDGT